MKPTGSEPQLPQNSADGRGTTMDAPASVAGNARLWAMVLGAGIVAGVSAWLGGEASLNMIKPVVHAASSRGLVLGLSSRREIAAAEAKNAAVAFALLGASIGTGMGLAGGLVRRSGRAAAKAALFGLIAGTVVSAALSLALLPAYNVYKARHPDEASQDLTLPLLVHLCIWSGAGLVAGWALAIGLDAKERRARIALGGLAGAALGAVAYELIGALVFPGAQTSAFVSSTWETRLFARLAVAVLAAGGAALAAGRQQQRAVVPAK
jgi:hypothetical protein